MNALPAHGEPHLVGQTVLVTGDSAGIGLETRPGDRPWSSLCAVAEFDIEGATATNSTLTGATFDIDGGQQLVGI